jgi:hypothetical protein
VRTFLRLAGYYRRFIRDFSTIASSLTKLLCKELFMSTAEAEGVFSVL